MPDARVVHVHLLPDLVPSGRLAGAVAVVVDVLRASTTIVHALAAGCSCVRPCVEIDEARRLAEGLPAGKALLAGERGGLPVPGFDLGNSPREFTCKTCRDTILVFTTTNGTRAILRAAEAARVLIGAFVNYSALCEQLEKEARPVHIICSGTEGEVALEDSLLAGALVDSLCDVCEIELNDSARLAWDCFEHHGSVLQGALELGRGGQKLSQLGYHEDIRAAARVDQFNLVPELRQAPLRLEVGAIGIAKNRWLR